MFERAQIFSPSERLNTAKYTNELLTLIASRDARVSATARFPERRRLNQEVHCSTRRQLLRQQF